MENVKLYHDQNINRSEILCFRKNNQIWITFYNNILQKICGIMNSIGAIEMTT